MNIFVKAIFMKKMILFFVAFYMRFTSSYFSDMYCTSSVIFFRMGGRTRRAQEFSEPDPTSSDRGGPLNQQIEYIDQNHCLLLA